MKKLAGLEISGAARVKASDIETDGLALKLSGAGQVSIEALSAEVLEVDSPGAGAINVSGKVEEQRIAISGAGSELLYSGGFGSVGRIMPWIGGPL